MGFLAPWFLAGIVAVGIPIYVHLLRQYRQTPLPFSSLMFFEQRTQSSIKHRRLKYLLLFALRCAFIALLVLAFMRPYVHSRAIARAGGGRTLVFAVDNSFSMRQGDRFTRAKQSALEQVNSMRQDDRGQVISFGGPAKLLTDMTKDKQALRAAITALEPTDAASSYAELSRVLRSTQQSLKTEIEGHVFTDLQKSSLPASFTDLKLQDGTKLELHAVGSTPLPNWTVETVDAPRRVFDTKKVRTIATVVGFDSSPATRHVTLFANGKPLETKQVKVPANGRATVEFLSLDAPYGLSRGEVRLDGGDAFPQDDHRFFAIERADPKPALLVHAPGDAASPLYVRTALDSSNEPAFNLESLATSQAANATVKRYALIILSDSGPVPAKLESALREYVQAGGSVLVSLGKNAGIGRHIPVADIPVIGLHTIAPERERLLTVASVDTSYPAFSRAANWDGVEFYQVARLQMPPASPDTRIAATLSDGTPLLVDRKVGEGHVLIFASTFDNIANNLPLQPVWVPFLEQTTHELGGIGAAPGNYKVGSFIELRTAREKNVPVEIIGPDGRRVMTLAESAKAQTFQFPSQGFFDIRRANGREELAAVNPDPRESDFSIVPAETLDLWKKTGDVPKSEPGGLNSQNETAELWWWVLAVLALLAVVESVLGNQHLSSEKATKVMKKEAA